MSDNQLKPCPFCGNNTPRYVKYITRKLTYEIIDWSIDCCFNFGTYSSFGTWFKDSNEGKKFITDKWNKRSLIEAENKELEQKQLSIDELREQFEKYSGKQNGITLIDRDDSGVYRNEYLQCEWEGYKDCAIANNFFKDGE